MDSTSLAGRLRLALAGQTKAACEPHERVAAAVLVLLFVRDGEPWVVFTRRSNQVRNHKGEMSFPGGARDPSDSSLADTALRETAEEIGIDPSQIEIVAELDDLPTYSSGFVISPFVGVARGPLSYSPSEVEIDEVVELPLRELAEVGKDATYQIGEHRFTTQVFELRGQFVWGATGRILRGFLDLLAPLSVTLPPSDSRTPLPSGPER